MFDLNVEKINIDDIVNRFFFFNPINLKVYMYVIKAIQASLQRIKKMYIFLYKPLINTIKYINSLSDFKIENKIQHNMNNKLKNIVYTNLLFMQTSYK
jgi:hypothetical protein